MSIKKAGIAFQDRDQNGRLKLSLLIDNERFFAVPTILKSGEKAFIIFRKGQEVVQNE